MHTINFPKIQLKTRSRAYQYIKRIERKKDQERPIFRSPIVKPDNLNAQSLFPPFFTMLKTFFEGDGRGGKSTQEEDRERVRGLDAVDEPSQ